MCYATLAVTSFLMNLNQTQNSGKTYHQLKKTFSINFELEALPLPKHFNRYMYAEMVIKMYLGMVFRFDVRF